jgi:glycine/D-amino acid oxidase-like deaminating enzyme
MRPLRCAVIGAGVLGAGVAARLAEAGAAVTLLEQDQPWLNANRKTPRTYHDLNHAGMRAWAELAASAGQPAWYQSSGNLEWAGDAQAHAELAARVRRLTEWGYPAGFLDAASALELEPALRLPAPAAEVAWFPDEGYLLTEPAVGYLVDLAAGYGARVLTGEPGRVTGFGPLAGQSPAGGGRAVQTAGGELIAGRWVPELARRAGATASVPLVPWEPPGAEAPGLVVRAGPVSGLTRMVHAPRVYLRPHGDSLIHLEAPDAAVDLHTPDAELRRWAAELLHRGRRVIRGLEESEVTGYRVCVRPMPADGRSVVGWLPGAGRVYVAVTHSGVTLGAQLGRLVAAEVAGGAELPELAPYRPGRFAAANATFPAERD